MTCTRDIILSQVICDCRQIYSLRRSIFSGSPDPQVIFIRPISRIKFSHLVCNTGPGREMRSDESKSVARKSVDHAWCPSLGLMKLIERDMCEKFKSMVRENERSLEKKTTQTLFRPLRNSYGVTEMRTQYFSGGRRATNRFSQEATLEWNKNINNLLP